MNLVSCEYEHEQPIFRVTNHHTDACGRPPAIDDSEPNRYLGYFENEHGEQAVFVYDRARRVGTLSLGDAGWERSLAVVNGALKASSGSNRAGVAGCVLEGGDACLSCSRPGLRPTSERVLARARCAGGTS